ncbi:preferentially expressed antigen in melanoma-like protein 7 [Acomys russatus]|uniref:preferentially expressed antigen in melanoma-like protein 7 n=1 Tax=Acomys russatus TaxID=60746 RepID=UPI0021E1E9CE|nr:preferentially expressed antigen in melanoma-like protein 7 [Acomys russatus]
MKICAFPVEIIRDVLDIFKPHYIEELELFTNQVLSFLRHFAPCLGHMRNLPKFHLHHIYLNSDRVVNTLADREKNSASKFLAQFSKLNCLQHLSMNWIYLSTDHVKQFCRYLKTPLESLSITHSHLSQSLLKHLSGCQSLRQLKYLNLNDIVLSTSHPTGLQLLLKNVADFLRTPELQHCNPEDSHISFLLPALSQCFQLTRVNFYDNNFSMAVLKDLLHCKVNLNKLTVEFYTAPVE